MVSKSGNSVNSRCEYPRVRAPVMSVPSRHLVIRPISCGQDATIARSRASSSGLSALGKLNKTMCWRVIFRPQ